MSATSRVTAILSWYDEPVEALSMVVASMAGVADHLVAVDGAYAMLEDGRPRSPRDQARAIQHAAAAIRIGLTLHLPNDVWYGNEVEKRTYALRLAEGVTDPEGWYIALDADTPVIRVVEDWHARVRAVAEDGWGAMSVGVVDQPMGPAVLPDAPPAARAVLANAQAAADANPSPVRLMYRALRGAEYGPTHWTIHAPDPDDPLAPPVCLWGSHPYNPVDAYDGTGLIVLEHRRNSRPYDRVMRQRRYYAVRDRAGIEREVARTTLRGSDRPLGRR